MFRFDSKQKTKARETKEESENDSQKGNAEERRFTGKVKSSGQECPLHTTTGAEGRLSLETHAAPRLSPEGQTAKIFAFDVCNSYRYTIQCDQELPASRRGEVFPHRIESWDSTETCNETAPATVRSRQCAAAGRHECSGMEAASAGGATQGSLGDQRQRELAFDVQI